MPTRFNESSFCIQIDDGPCTLETLVHPCIQGLHHDEHLSHSAVDSDSIDIDHHGAWNVLTLVDIDAWRGSPVSKIQGEAVSSLLGKQWSERTCGIVLVEKDTAVVRHVLGQEVFVDQRSFDADKSSTTQQGLAHLLSV